MVVKGLYVIENYPFPDFKELEIRGLTHVFYSDSFLLNNYNTCKNNVNALIDEMKGTKLELHININAFKASDQSSLVDPENMDHRNKLQTALTQLLLDIPKIDGVIFDDFHWHMWSGYDVNQQADILSEFAKQMATAIHDVDPSKKLSAAILWTSPTINLTAA